MSLLRPYQVDLIDRVRASYAAGKAAPLLQLATGAGKTVIAAHVMKRASERGKRTAFLVHRVELIAQTARTLRDFDIPHGVIHPAYAPVAHRLQVASVQTLVRRLDRHPRFDFIVVDECHHALAATWQSILAAYPDAYLLGLTATPSRLDGQGLGVDYGGLFDDLIVGPTMHELTLAGYLAKTKVFVSPHHLDLSRLSVRAGDYAAEQVDRVMRTDAVVGDAVEHYRRHLAGKRAIAFCISVGAADMTAQRFVAEGVAARRIDGRMRRDERAALVRDFTEGRVKVLTSCDLISEGFDVPACDGALLLRPTLSEALYLQQVGRALRPAPGKEYAVILDHVGNVARHGLPSMEREWSLAGRIRRGPNDVPDHLTCASCYAVLQRADLVDGCCPECEALVPIPGLSSASGANGDGDRQRELDTVDGELIELTPEQMETLRRQRRDEVRAARSREELLDIARRRGYNRRWVDHVLRSREAR
jgi:DNA repair protein RadD